MKNNIDKDIENKEELIRKISKEKYGNEYFIETAILSYKAQQEKIYTFFRDDSKEDLLTKYNWCQRPHEDSMSLHRFLPNGEIEAHISESLAENFGLIQVDLNEFIFKFVQPIVKDNIKLKSELETYKKIVDEKNKELNEENLRCSKLAVENNDLKEKLETYKKIAEKLAEDLSKHIWLNDKDAIIKIYREEVEEDETHS